MVATKDITFQTLADHFVAEYRAGRCRSVEQFAAEYPAMADLILREFPAIIVVEQLRDSRMNSTLNMPKKIGRYVVESQIGSGGMGKVYAAKHPDLNREVAIKVLFLKGLRSPTMLERFHVEARASALLNHPHIVPVYDHGTEDELAYLVMRRIRGLPIDRVVARIAEERKSGKASTLQMDWHLVASIGAQIASALTYAHEQGIIHRDIKPANLIMETPEKVWITDFGLAKLTERDLELSTAGDIIGTPKYMAPEQFRGICDQRSDIYGLGLTLYELASGQRVWQSIGPKELIEHRSSIELPELKELNPAIPDAVCDIIMRCCALKPEDRYQTAKELNFVLNRFAHGNPVGDRRRSVNSARSIWKRKTWMLALTAGFFGSIAVVSGTLSYLMQPESPFQDPEAAMKVLDDDKLRSRFVKELPSLFNEMVRNDDPKFRDAIGTLAHQSITKTVQQYDLASEDKQKIERTVGGWINSYKSGELSHPEVSLLFHGFAQSPVANALRFQKAPILVQNSTMSEAEKHAAWKLLHRLHLGLVEKKISHATSGALFDTMNQILVPQSSGAEGTPPLISDRQLRIFLYEVQKVVDEAGIEPELRPIEAAQPLIDSIQSVRNDFGINEVIPQSPSPSP